MKTNKLSELSEIVQSVSVQNTFLYFITRVLKPNVKRTQKVMDKFVFNVYQIDINDDIRKHLHTLTIEQLKHLATKKTELHEYDVISDETEHLFTYQMTNNAMSFHDVVFNQLKSSPPKIYNLEKLVEDEELWAYSVGFSMPDKNWIYTFRKILSGKVAIDEKDSNKRTLAHKALRTMFNTTSQKLELIQGQTINLDKQVDCIFFTDTFYIARKRQFEQIVGLEAEYKEKAILIVSELSDSKMFEGIEFLSAQVEKNVSLHKKLVRISNIGNFRSLNSKTLTKMERISKQYGTKIKLKNGKILIEDETDIELTLKMLADYYKKGEVSGKSYGTFAGKHIVSTNPTN